MGEAPDFATFVSQGNYSAPTTGTGSTGYGKVSELDEAQQVKAYNNFRSELDRFAAAGDQERYWGALKIHNFNMLNAPRGSGGGSSSGSSSSSSGASSGSGGSKKSSRDDITPPAKGLESTIKTSPTLLREKRRKSYLTS